MKATSLAALLIISYTVPGYSQNSATNSTATTNANATNNPASSIVQLATNSQKPSHSNIGNRMLSEDQKTFDEITAPMAAEAPVGNLVIQAIQKNPEVLVLENGGSWSGGGVQSLKETVKPKDGMMLVRVIFDFYSDKGSGVLWLDDIALLGADGTSAQPFQLEKLLGKGIVEVGFVSLDIDKGCNRIAVTFTVKDGDPSQLHLQINSKDYGTLASLKK